MMQKWTPAKHAERFQLLKLLFGLTIDHNASTILLADSEYLLTYSISKRLIPRVWFLVHRGVLSNPESVWSSDQFTNIYSLSEAEFSKKYNRPDSCCPPQGMRYDTAYIRHWQERWQFLAQDMNLSVKDIASHQAVLLASLPCTLAPRWKIFTLLAANQPGFKAGDHLTAMATLCDDDFAREYSINSLNVVYDRS